jgi:hypothetical protein
MRSGGGHFHGPLDVLLAVRSGHIIVIYGFDLIAMIS